MRINDVKVHPEDARTLVDLLLSPCGRSASPRSIRACTTRHELSTLKDRVDRDLHDSEDSVKELKETRVRHACRTSDSTRRHPVLTVPTRASVLERDVQAEAELRIDIEETPDANRRVVRPVRPGCVPEHNSCPSGCVWDAGAQAG